MRSWPLLGERIFPKQRSINETRHTHDALAADALVIGYWQANEKAFFPADLPGYVPTYNRAGLLGRNA